MRFSYVNLDSPDAVSILMGLPIDWKAEQLLLADNVYCARNKDEIGLRFEFDCKMVHLMKVCNFHV
jgi:hypothetical protein